MGTCHECTHEDASYTLHVLVVLYVCTSPGGPHQDQAKIGDLDASRKRTK